MALLVLSPVPASAEAPTGTVEGRITDRHGAPADAHVTAEAVSGGWSATAYTWDLGDGRYRIEGVPAGDYRISIYDNSRGFQWVPGAEDRAAATVFTVAGGQTLTVDEEWLPGGAVRVTVVDAETGAPVPRPCVQVHTYQAGWRCGTNGVVTLDDMQPGTWLYAVTAAPDYFPLEPDSDRRVTITRGMETALTAELRRGSGIQTTAVDAETGAPLANICVSVADPAAGGMHYTRTYSPLGSACSDESGVLRIGPLAEPIPVQLYAWELPRPTAQPNYGDQWMTADGGTGDQREALIVTPAEKQTVVLPEIRMDRPGTVTGVVTSAATGQPAQGTCVYPYAVGRNAGLGSGGRHCTDATGRYTLSTLGPYEWPLEFVSVTRAWQRSGGTADRFAATPVAVTAGGTATADASVPEGGVLTIEVTGGDGAPVAWGHAEVRNAVTGDHAAHGYIYDGAATLGALHTEDVLVHVSGDGFDCWHGPVAVTAGGTTAIALDIATHCGTRP
ncbi:MULTISPECIES: carboxypeptidase regulatory-like domain-containing protein [Catenuloplanes]|uniref:Uncharacterized protein n=1 Tax=Catenuloplanes niger TaxID=587534 RepID=A0AAE4CT23_9ACTN|nr:carboxypeptidase regulatory-like domain-containing protein [Catenuloplanes niger]MDR7322962.1 hypothetical protein [Catenuloplanes niger]